MASKIETLELEGAEVHSAPLPYEKAEDLLPDVAEIVARGFDQVSPELAKLIQDGGEISKDDPRMMIVLIPAISGILRQLGGGKLKSLVPRLVATTSVIIEKDGEKLKYDLVDKAARASCFDERPDIYFETLYHAGKVTFARFFPGSGRRAAKQAATG